MTASARPTRPSDLVSHVEHEGYWEARFQSAATLPLLKAQIEELRVFCAQRNPARILVDMRAVAGPLSVTDRYELGVLAGAFTGLVSRVVIVVERSLLDPQKFAITVAQNRGLKIDVFDNPEAAVTWLMQP